ncbi:hypothetical protein K9L16_03330 [Candidatus Pacearchaeota archaeon]|nr:hypothetical protein [Candidatus Pacearchaeota archaeon]
MILYFDNLITNIPLNPGIFTDLDRIRSSCSSYSTNDRYYITLYTLASYAEIKWSEVVIVYEFEKDLMHKKQEFEKFVKDLFPKAHIFYGRSDNQKKFQEKVKFINNLNDEWIFYAGNNDHPFMAPNKKTLNACLEKAKEWGKNWSYVSIVYSHFAEAYNMAKKGNAYHDLVCFRSKIINEDKNCFVSLFNKGYAHSIQIMNKKLINQMVFSKNLGQETFKRIEAMAFHPKTKRPKQIVIIPKESLCEHFDGYSHLKGSSVPISSNLIPPLFIPEGFFGKKIKIRYGYEEYKKGWVNINPLKKKYIFEDKNGADLKIGLEDIPLFWKKRISKIDINKNIDKNFVERKAKELKEKRKNPFMSIKDKNYKIAIFKRKFITGGYLPYFMIAILRKNNALKNFRKKMNKFKI